MLIDSHCHLNYFEEPERSRVISEAWKNGVQNLFTIATRFADREEILSIANLDKRIYASVGIHPSEAKNETAVLASDLVGFIQANPSKVIGIGETGLDYYYDADSKDEQTISFKEHIKAAQITNLPLIVHSREAESDTYEMLKDSGVKILMHCFTGTTDFMLKMVELGAYISYSGIATFKNSKDLQETIKLTPSERILVETDSPYLAPVPMRGKKNEPGFVKYTADFISELLGMEPIDFYNLTGQNFKTLFHL
jgi:TatD DNase family protein